MNLPDWVMNKIKRQDNISFLGHQNEVIFVGGISGRHPKSEHFVFSGLLRIHGPIRIYFGRREGGKEEGRY